MGGELRLAPLRRDQDGVDQVRAQRVAQLREPAAGQLQVQVGGQPEAEPELRVVLEQGVRPGRPAPVRVGRPRCGGQVPAVDRGAAGRVGDHEPVAEQLRQHLQVGRLAAAGAGAGELEQRQEVLGAAHGAEVDPGPVVDRQRLEERDGLPPGGQLRFPRREVDGLAGRLGRYLHRAGLHAQPAAGAVLQVDLKGVLGVRQAPHVQRHRREAGRRAVQLRLVVELGTDDAVRADEAAVAALDAGVGVPERHQVGDVALLERGGAAGVGAVDRQGADRQVVAVAGHHRRGDGLDELRVRAPARWGAGRGWPSRGPARRRGAGRTACGPRRRGCARRPRCRAGRTSW